MTLQIGLTTRS